VTSIVVVLFVSLWSTTTISSQPTMDLFNDVVKQSLRLASDAYTSASSVVSKAGIGKMLYIENNLPEPPAPAPTGINWVALLGETSPWIRVAGLSGAVAVSMGAYGAHGLKRVGEDQKAVFETANRYHMIHTLAMLAVPMVNRPNLVGSLLVIGTTIFSGTCYIHGITGDENIIRFTPYGGMTLICAWLAMII